MATQQPLRTRALPARTPAPAAFRTPPFALPAPQPSPPAAAAPLGFSFGSVGVSAAPVQRAPLAAALTAPARRIDPPGAVEADRAAPSAPAAASGPVIQRVRAPRKRVSASKKLKYASRQSKADRMAGKKSGTVPLKARRGRYGLGQHGYKKNEQKRLAKAHAVSVTGDTHESEHAVGFEPLNQTSGETRGVGSRARGLENRAPAYQEVKSLHRAHIGTGTRGYDKDVGFSARSYRDSQRALVEDGDVSSAVQLNQLGYAFDEDFRKLGGTRAMNAADDSFNTMVGNLSSLSYAQGGMDVETPVDAKQRAEMYLSRIAARTGKFPTEAEENEARKKFGLEPIKKKG